MRSYSGRLGGAFVVVVLLLAIMPGLPGSQAQGGSTLTIAQTQNPRGLHPQRDTGIEGNLVLMQIVDRLINVDRQGQLVPGLATSWEMPDDTTVVFHLRQGVRFHDGTPFDADAVVFNFNLITDLEASVLAGLYGPRIASVEAVDPLTVRVNLTTPWPDFLTRMANQSELGIHSPTAFRAAGDAYGSTVVVGTGPFKFV
ncbi:MAG: hypothetical protein HY335_11280, partial [Deinococcus sp.]|nr:hypothetical protein [Deinococcus sp.]